MVGSTFHRPNLCIPGRILPLAGHQHNYVSLQTLIHSEACVLGEPRDGFTLTENLSPLIVSGALCFGDINRVSLATQVSPTNILNRCAN
ncbi:hypothetical protein JL09_g5081 [Pichia kudriavzevii]|uniref:Uncharacterized protein n=1 Tax=Pichia kudriavzevii TaxID=4909 RepID=A0A099NUW2_PICKU|nr:hypothetical protein JL09_g5081 [Pichia kudriavzevii]